MEKGAGSLQKISLRWDHEGAVLRITLDAPPGNILDAVMIASLRHAVHAERDIPELRLIVITGAGDNFSFGSSIEEHRPEHAREMLASFHGLFQDLIECNLPLLALVNGQCLGGGLELAAFCDWVFALDNATFGQPEIKLGVFAPVGSIVLPWRMGGRANDLLLSGRSIDAKTAESIGLVNRVLAKENAEQKLEAFIEENLLPLSATSLRHARNAARWHLNRQMKHGLPELESLYLDELMKSPDAVEGITAFLEKRPPRWSS
jgi:cyclohexa-1,5-dienecarbonyl-CoA hydratase